MLLACVFYCADASEMIYAQTGTCKYHKFRISRTLNFFILSSNQFLDDLSKRLSLCILNIQHTYYVLFSRDSKWIEELIRYIT